MSSASSHYVADIRPPRLRHSVGELGRVAFEAGTSILCKRLFRTLPRGDGHSIMTIPGFMGADGSTALLRKFLVDRGYHAVPWGLGRNASDARAENMQQFMRHRAALEEKIAARV